MYYCQATKRNGNKCRQRVETCNSYCQYHQHPKYSTNIILSKDTVKSVHFVETSESKSFCHIFSEGICLIFLIYFLFIFTTLFIKDEVLINN